jgi:hypothetical protein
LTSIQLRHRQTPISVVSLKMATDKSKGLLPFQNTILEEINDPSTSELVIVSRGLGLRTLVCRLLQLYESSNCLVLLINASQEEELGIGEQLGLLGCRSPGLRIVGYEMPKKERCGKVFSYFTA